MSNASNIMVEVVTDTPAWQSHGITDELVRHAMSALWAQLSDGITRSEVTVLLSDDARIRDLNIQFRQKDMATNVLSFPSGDDEYIGDIALAFETVVREASELGVTVHNHVTHLVIHGALHLLGHDHENEEEAQEMERIEVLVLKDLGIKNPYIENGSENTERLTTAEHGQP